jgi:hypothetical protein
VDDAAFAIECQACGHGGYNRMSPTESERSRELDRSCLISAHIGVHHRVKKLRKTPKKENTVDGPSLAYTVAMRIRSLLSFASLSIMACASTEEAVTEDDFSSDQATLLDFEFQGELEADNVFDAKSTINDQLLYTIGQLNGSNSVGRLDTVVLTEMKQSAGAGGKTKVTYKAKLPVAWGEKTNLPTTYEFVLPKDVSYAGQQAFTSKYKGTCAEFGAHDVDAGSMWYYYRPSQCTPAAADIVKFSAKVSLSVDNTAGKFPEYDKVWEDGALNMVAIFGKYKDGTTSNDAGIDGYNLFIDTMKRELSAFSLVTTPAVLPNSPGVSLPDVSFAATLPDGKKVSVTALMVDNIGQTNQAFDDRYNALSTNADVIAYNGHAGLGQNVRALAQKGSWKAGKYVIVFMNGCDTFAYVDGSLAQTRARINADDPKGTKYMEFVTNALPAFFSNMPSASTTLMKGLLRFNTPMTYEQIFQGIDNSQVVVVTGEEDNTFTPGAPTQTWAGIREAFTLSRGTERRFETGVLPAGKYEFALSGTGNADLFVKTGRRATSRTFDCRPRTTTSQEMCTVTLAAPSNISVLVRGSARVDSAVSLAATKR